MPRTEQSYTVGWVCAIPIELAAATAILDEEYEPLPMSNSDSNIYKFGRVGIHHIVIACLPSGRSGTSSAATVASEMRGSFPDLRFSLMVGVGGGVPSALNDIRLGDIAVSLPTGTSGGVVQYDFGKTMENGRFYRTGSLNKPPRILLDALSWMQAANPNILMKTLRQITSQMGEKDDRFHHPGRGSDKLFGADSEHIDSDDGYDSCVGCDRSKLVNRIPRSDDCPSVHYGIIASGNQVIKHGVTRERLSKEVGAICFEMEAAGLMDDFPCLVVRGICDYADSHKNKFWQPYAAATAAAFAKELLRQIPITANIANGNAKKKDFRLLPNIQSSQEPHNVFSGTFYTGGGKAFLGTSFNSAGDMHF